MTEIELALRIATEAHQGQMDLDGNLHLLHVLQVGLMGQTDEERMAGFLHDVVEDTAWTFDDLLTAGIPEGIVNALRLLTHDESMPYMDYVQRIIDNENPIALMVKYHDLQHNFARGKAYPELQAKHGPALEKVKTAVEVMNRVELYSPHPDVATAVFAAGCFWGVQHYFDRQPGVLKTLVGYTGGEEPHPTYSQVRSHQTHHVEAILVEYDPQQVDYETLCKLFFEIHDPAQTDGQGPDLGPQYRSMAFYAHETQKATIEHLINILRAKGFEVNTLVQPLTSFWIAEAWHQHYYEHTGGSPYCHVRVRKF